MANKDGFLERDRLAKKKTFYGHSNPVDQLTFHGSNPDLPATASAYKSVVYLKHRPTRPTLGIIDHWFFDIPSLNLEIHPGDYGRGTHLTSGYTKGAHTYKEITVCEDCLNKLVKTSLHLNKVFYYPFINCETLVSHDYCTSIVSTQLIAITIIVVASLLIVFNLFLVVCIILTIIIYLLFSKYTYSVTIKAHCKHVDENNIHDIPLLLVDTPRRHCDL